MSVRMAICVAAIVAGVQWLGASSVQNVPSPAFRPAVTAGGYVYVSTLKAAANTAEDVAAQTQSVFAQLTAMLEASRSS